MAAISAPLAAVLSGCQAALLALQIFNPGGLFLGLRCCHMSTELCSTMRRPQGYLTEVIAVLTLYHLIACMPPPVGPATVGSDFATISKLLNSCHE